MPNKRKSESAIPTTVFLSYSRKDISIANWLRNELKEKEFQVFQDLPDTLPGEEWWSRLKQLIRESDQVIFLMSENSNSSKVCAEEIRYALDLQKRIFPVLIDNIDWRSVPEGLSKIQGIYLTNSGERASSMAILTKAMGTDLNWFREHTRLYNRALRWKNKGMKADELLTGDSLHEAEEWLSRQSPKHAFPTSLHQEFIFHSRKAEIANQERTLKESEEQKKKIDEQRGKAENNFRAGIDIITEIQHRIIENLKQTRGVSSATQEYAIQTILSASQKLKNNDPDFYPSSVQMQLAGNELYATTSLAEVFLRQGKFKEAEFSAKEAYKLSEAFRLDDYNPLQRRPGLLNTSKTLAILAEIYSRQNENSKAKEYLEECRYIQEKGLEYYSNYSEAEDFRTELAETFHRLSVTNILLGKKEEALLNSQEALKHAEYLLHKDEDNQHLQIKVAIAQSSVADSLIENNRLEEAQKMLDYAINMFSKDLETSPDNLFLLHWKSICLERLGNVYMFQKAYTDGFEVFEQTLSIKKQLVEADPNDIHYQNDLKIISSKYESAKQLANT